MLLLALAVAGIIGGGWAWWKMANAADMGSVSDGWRAGERGRKDVEP